MSISIAQLSAEHHHNGIGLQTPTPRLSWRFNPTTLKSWTQASYEVLITRNTKQESFLVTSPQSILVPWPSTPLSSREIASVKVRVTGEDGSISPWASLTIEAALLEREDWKCKLISGLPQDPNKSKKPFRMRKAFHCSKVRSARLYATGHGLYEVSINGQSINEQVLAPGWQSYRHRLHYQIYDIGSLLQEGENVIGVTVAEGWFAGRLCRPSIPNIWGERIGFLAQVEGDGNLLCETDESWEVIESEYVSAEIYDGEVVDSVVRDEEWTSSSRSVTKTEITARAQELPFPTATLISPDMAPVKRVIEIKPVQLITTLSGKQVLDFGQNLVGWLRIERDFEGRKGSELCIKHAEVMEHGELGVRPLRTAKAQVVIRLGGKTKGYEPKFAFFGFRYAEISGCGPITLADFTAIVISTDLRRTGTFTSSHPLVNKLHQNTVWSMRGNFISIPTDCPQRDERLGWTGDIQIFAPTAAYLFDTSAFLSDWLEDLSADQRDAGGSVPWIIPSVPNTSANRQNRPAAAWADAAVITPWDLYSTYGDKAVLERQWESMCLWLDKGIKRDERGFYTTEHPQFGDWLDPRAPPSLPGHAMTDPFFVANAYLIYVTKLAAEIGKTIGKVEIAQRYSDQASRLLDLFQQEYITPTGRLVSDTQTAFTLALRFGLLPEKHIDVGRARLSWLVRWELFRINTGFVGTPIILNTLAENGMLNLAYRMLEEQEDPSWLYPISMGATTIWERWNSMLPDGSINPGQMTSFNHYALGSVCNFLHSVVGGLSSTSPGWKTALVKPQPGGTISHAATSFDSPYGLYSVRWECKDGKMITDVSIPLNGQARVLLNGVDEIVGSGEYSWTTDWQPDAEPPKHIQGAQGQPM
ncbi:bacterial alpha-L-rhamnosidase-domain-containing protein, partial [Cadophora sp. MPI-SDFR-AT-0126]